MKRIAVLILCAMLFISLSACQPSQQALLRQGIETEVFDPAALCERVEAAMLNGEREVSLNYRGRQATVEQGIRKGLGQAQQNGSYLIRRFLSGYDVTCTEEKGYVAARITLRLAEEALLADMPRRADGLLQVEAYEEGTLETLLTGMMQADQQQALRLYQWQGDLESLNAALNQDLVHIRNTNYAYVYLVASAKWMLSQYPVPNGQPLVELDISLQFEPDSIPLSEIPVVDSSLEMIDALVDGWAAGEEKVTLILENIRPDEQTLFSWINTAEVNSASLACEGDSVWYELLENPGERQVGRFWLEFNADENRIAKAQAELTKAIKREVEVLKAKLAGVDMETAYRAVFDRVLEMVEYDDDIREATEKKTLTEEMQILRSSYGALVAGKTVCTGYARAFQALCNELGLPCWTVNGYKDGEGHAWNMVRLNDETLYVDCTFADTGGRPDKYFLFSAEQMEKQKYVPDDGFVTRW